MTATPREQTTAGPRTPASGHRMAPRMRRGTVLTVESVPASPGAHTAGPPPFYQWRRGTSNPEEELRRVHAIAGTMGAAIIEVVQGQRSIRQLTRWVHPDLLTKILRRAGLEAAPAQPGLGNPFLSHRFDGTGPRPRRVRALRVAPEEYEASVVVDVGGRCRALALRIHKPRGQWQIVEAEIG